AHRADRDAAERAEQREAVAGGDAAVTAVRPVCVGCSTVFVGGALAATLFPCSPLRGLSPSYRSRAELAFVGNEKKPATGDGAGFPVSALLPLTAACRGCRAG